MARCVRYIIRRGLSVLLIRFRAAKAWILGKLMQKPALFLWTYLVTRSCWIDIWLPSSHPVQHHLRLLTLPSGGHTKLLKLIRLLLAAFTLQSSELCSIFCSPMAVLLWSLWGVHYTAKSQRTCKRPMIAIGYCSYRSETTHAHRSPTLKPVIGSQPTSPRKSSLPHSTTQANSRHYIIA